MHLSIKLAPQQLIDKMEFEALCNVTERVWEVMKRTAPITHWLSALADKLKFECIQIKSRRPVRTPAGIYRYCEINDSSTEVSRPEMVRDKLLTAPASSLISVALAVPMTWEEVPKATPWATSF